MTIAQAPNNDFAIEDIIALALPYWRKRWLIGFCVAAGFALSVGFIFVAEYRFETRVKIASDISIPFGVNASAEFGQSLEKPENFKAWSDQQTAAGRILSFGDVSGIDRVGDLTISQVAKDRPVMLEVVPKKGNFLLIRSRNVSFISAVMDYAGFTRQILQEKYVVLVRKERSLLEQKFTTTKTPPDALIQQTLALNRFMGALEEGGSILLIDHPTKPRQVWPRPLATLFVGLVAGLMAGLAWVFLMDVRDRIRYQQNSQT